MDFFEKIGETISSKGREVADKAKELAEITNLRGQINACEEVIKKNYSEIGRLYYEKHKEEPEHEWAEQCMAVTNAMHGVDALEAKIRELKGM